MPDIWTVLQERRRTAAGSPVVTFIDADGARVELSAVTLENAAAKVAGALVDEFDLAAGAVVSLRLPVHWQRAAWLAGSWVARARVALDGVPTDEPIELVVTTAARASDAVGAGVPVAVVSDHPLGLPVADPLPVGAVDATVAVRTAPDVFLGDPPVPTDAALLAGIATLTQAEVLDLAAERATAWGLRPDGRLVVHPGSDPVDAWLAALAVPLVVSASVVLVAGDHDLDRIAAQERATALLR